MKKYIAVGVVSVLCFACVLVFCGGGYNPGVANVGLNTTHRNDNSQAHTDYLLNSGADETSGVLTTAGLTLSAGSLTMTAAVDIIRDEDDMVTDDVNALCTQQSIKKYVDDQAGAPTMELFIPALLHNTTADNAYTGTAIGSWPIASMLDNGAVRFAFLIPNDFTALVDAVIVVIPDATEQIQWDLTVSVSALGENHDDDVTVNEDMTDNVTINDLTELDISTEMGNAVASDYIGISFASDTSSIKLLGLRLRYN